MIKTLNKMGIEGTHLKITKAIYERTTANAILNREKLKFILLTTGTRQECPVLLLFNTALAVRAIRPQKKHPKWKRRSKTLKLTLFVNDMYYKTLGVSLVAWWVKDSVRIQCCGGYGAGHSCSSDSTPGPGPGPWTSMCHRCSCKKKKKKFQINLTVWRCKDTDL